MGYHVPNLREPDSYALEVIATLLSAGKSSRLYQSLVREKRLVLSADADHSLLSRDPSLFYLSAELLPGKEVVEVEKALDQEVERLKKELVGAQELEKAKNQMEASFVFGQDSLFYQAMLLARNEITLTWRAIDDYLPSIRKSFTRRYPAGGKKISEAGQPNGGGSDPSSTQRRQSPAGRVFH